MKDLSRYICTGNNGELWVDSYDIETSELTFNEGEVFAFTYHGKQYKGIDYDKGNECEVIQLVTD